MPRNAFLNAKMLVIALHLLEVCSIWICHKVQSVTPWCFISQNHISLVVLEHEMRVQVTMRIIISCFCGPHEILLASLFTVRNRALIEVTPLGCDVDFAFLLLSNMSKHRRMPT
jgi:hypothetical protein